MKKCIVGVLALISSGVGYAKGIIILQTANNNFKCEEIQIRDQTSMENTTDQKNKYKFSNGTRQINIESNLYNKLVDKGVIIERNYIDGTICNVACRGD